MPKGDHRFGEVIKVVVEMVVRLFVCMCLFRCYGVSSVDYFALTVDHI